MRHMMLVIPEGDGRGEPGTAPDPKPVEAMTNRDEAAREAARGFDELRTEERG